MADKREVSGAIDVEAAAKKAKAAAIRMAEATTQAKNEALNRVARALESAARGIAEENAADIADAEKARLSPPLIKRLKMDESKVFIAAQGVRSVAGLPDPIGVVSLETKLADGLVLRRVSCPIGVIGVIFESRPDALVQIASLCVKSGNAALLKGGSEGARSNRILFEVIRDACDGILPDGRLALLETRADIARILEQDEYVDLIIPRGSNAFVRHIMDNTRIPVLGHADGICSCYVDKDADLDMALKIVVDAKTQYVAVCNAAETLLVHADVAERFLPELDAAFKAQRPEGVEMRGDARAAASAPMKPAGETDWDTEFLDYTLAVKVVDGVDEAIGHINRHCSGHTDAIVTKNTEAARRFMSLVDSANVFHNCSTRFSDGFRYGFGAEVGVATGKLHPRGPVGLEGLSTYKYMLSGSGDIVADFEEKRRVFESSKAR